MNQQQKILFTGSGCAIVTPFHNDGSINYDQFSRLIDLQIEGGTDAIVVAGTTGEASTLSDQDHLALIDHCVKHVNGRVPVIAGCGSNHTAHAIELSKEAERLGVDGLLHVTPYYNKTSQHGLVLHFTAIADAVTIPIILYNIPSRTGVSIQAETYLELSKHPNIIGTKEASGDISLVAKTAALCGSAFGIYSGNDDQVVPLMALGGCGVISVIANVMPQYMHDLCQCFLDGNTKESLRMQLDILPMNAAMFCDVNPIPVKEALNMMKLNAGPLLLPLCETSDQNKGFIHKTLEDYKLI